MHTQRRNVVVVIGVLVAVVAVVAGATAATGWRADQPDQASAGVSGLSAQVPAPPGQVPDGMPGASGGLVDVLPDPPDAARDASLTGKAGTLMAQGDDLRIESVALAAPTTVEIHGLDREVVSVYRVTISAGPYVVRNMPAILAVDGVPLGVAIESVDLGSLVLYSHDDVVVTDGATITLSYGLPDAAPLVWSTTIEVVR